MLPSGSLELLPSSETMSIGKVITWSGPAVGANNVFNVYPDRPKNYRNTNEGMLIYCNEAMPFGYIGGYYYVNMSFNF